MRARKDDAHSVRRWIQTIAIGVGIGILVSALLLLIAAVLMTVIDWPDSAVSPVSVAALGIGALSAGWIAARRTGKNGLVLGSVSGLVILLITLIAGLLSFGTVQSGFALFKLAVSVLCGAIGGVLGVGGKKHR